MQSILIPRTSDMTDNRVVAVIGGQYGSEGKGLVVSKIWNYYENHVRVGAANAGHTGWIDGNKLVSQQLPMAAWAKSKSPRCYIGPGAVISLDILMREIEETGIDADRLFIDYRAHVITADQINREGETDLAARIGSTSTIAREGIGTATADRVMRSDDCVTTDDIPELAVYAADVPDMLNDEESILLEGTQGTGLSLTTGQFPYTTSRNTTVTGLMADAGVPANRLDRSIGVFRTFPIRVAGNSGPFFDGSEEVTFDDLGVDEERTTVTKLTRRIATWSDQQLAYSAMLNGMTDAYVTFFDYVVPSVYGLDTTDGMTTAEIDKMDMYIGKFAKLGINLRGFGTGPQSMIPLDGYLY